MEMPNSAYLIIFGEHRQKLEPFKGLWPMTSGQRDDEKSKFLNEIDLLELDII